MTDHSFNQEKMKVGQALVAKQIATTHVEAGHDVADTKYKVKCHTCGLVFGVSLPYDQNFGLAIQVYVTGDGRPYATCDLVEIRTIVYGTHKRFGIGSGKLSDEQRCKMYERSARYLAQMFDELWNAGPFDNADLEVRAQEAKGTLQVTRSILAQIASTNLKAKGKS